LREEADFQTVFAARLSSSVRRSNWTAGCKAEFWYWGFAAGMIAFALTLNFKLFFAITAASILWFWLSFGILQKKQAS